MHRPAADEAGVEGEGSRGSVVGCLSEGQIKPVTISVPRGSNSKPDGWEQVLWFLP